MENYEAKKRYKMYKAGKNWVVAPLVFLGLAMGVSVHNPKVMADTNVQSQTDNNNNNQTNKQEVTLQATQNTEAKTVVNQENSSQQASVESNQSVETNTSGVVDTTQQTSTNQEVKQSTPVTVQAQSAPVQQAAPANNNVTAQVTVNKVATAPATSATTSEQSQNTQVVNNSEQNSAAQSSTTQESEEPKVETPVNTADNASQKNVNGNWYLVDNNTGKNLTGFQEIKDQNKVVYYAPSNAQMQYGWQNINSNKYYFDKFSGAMTTGQRNIDGSWYLFDNQGVMQTGFQRIENQGKTVYYNKEGQMQYGQQAIGNHWYLFSKYNGAMQTGFQNLAEYGQDKAVYYNKEGQMQVGKVNIAGKVYNFDNKTGNLSMQGLVTLDGKSYLLNSNYKVLTGQQVVGNHWYLFSKYDGSMQTGFQNLAPYGQNKTVYYASNGQLQYGQQAVGNHWYLFDKSSGAMQTGIQNLAPYGQNKTVYYASNGQMQYGWQNINGKNYYFDTISGAMKTGTVNINGKNYTFNSDGTLKQDTWGWPFPSVGQGSFTGAQLFGVNPGGEFRANGFHDGLDFGSYDHPGSSVHAVHSGVVTQIGYIAGLENYVVVQSDEYSFVYQEAFSNRGNIKVRVGQQINTGDVIGYRDTSHLHLGITREKNIMRAIANSFNNNGTWLNPLELIRNGIANQ